jgi:uncharacterized RDD family membrane protein YckC
MNLEPSVPKKNSVKPVDNFLQDDDFDFKPITSGLGFHHTKTTQDIKPVFTDRIHQPLVPATALPVKNEMNVYQNDLSLFYGSEITEKKEKMITEEKIVRMASSSSRVGAYLLDLLMVLSLLGIVLTVMARTISMDLMRVWEMFPHEITPLVLVLFAGFYLIYFSVFEKSESSTLGKSIFKIKVVDLEQKPLPFATLMIRSFISLANFLSLGFFSYFDLQSKVTGSKVIKAD